MAWPGVFEVQRINPPPKSLGIHNLPADTHNGDQITVEDEVSRNLLINTSADWWGLPWCMCAACAPVRADSLCAAMQDFVVTSLVLQYKLVGGRYQRDHNRLEVQQTSRYFVNLYYDSLLEKSA